MVSIIETPRDAWQGIPDFIPTKKKASFIRLLAECGFDLIDIGSFVSASAVPQMKDTSELAELLAHTVPQSKFMVLAGNMKGALKSENHQNISHIAFPYSASGTFLKMNINADRKSAIDIAREMNDFCISANKKLIAYVTMAFGNPYGEKWGPADTLSSVEDMLKAGITNISLSDITGESTPETIAAIFKTLRNEFGQLPFGLHLHSTPATCHNKVEAAWQSGVKIFDTVLGGLGGCPMTKKPLTANLATESFLDFLETKQVTHQIDRVKLAKAKIVFKQINTGTHT